MPLTTTQQTEAYRFFAIAFNAAPGVEFMNQIAAAYEGGASTKQIVNEFTKKSVFTNLYPIFLTNEQFAARLIDNVVGAAATDAAKTEAKADVVAALAAGSSRGDVIFQIFTNLSKLSGDAKWGDMATKMANQVAVSRYYTETLLKSSTDVPTLQAVLSGVDQKTDVSSAALETRLNPPASKSFVLTTGVDSGDAFKGGTGNDEYAAAYSAAAGANTLGALDVLDGGAGTDTLRITNDNSTNAYTMSAAQISNIENITIRGSAAVTADVSGTNITGLRLLEVTQATDTTLTAGTGANVSVTGATGAVSITGGSAVTVVTGTAGKDISVAGSAGAISITDSAVGAASVTATGGTNVTIVASGSTGAAGKKIVVGGAAAADRPTGTVSVTSNHTAVAGTAQTLNPIEVTGGSTISVTQVADTSKAAADKVGGSLTFGTVTATSGGTATSVTLTQGATVPGYAATDATTGVRETGTYKFTELKAGASITIGTVGGTTSLTFTAAKDLTAAEVATAVSNLISTAAPLELTSASSTTNGESQGSGVAANGTYTGRFTAYTAAAASGDTVVFTSATSGNAADLTFSVAQNGASAAPSAPTLVGTYTQGVSAVAADPGMLTTNAGVVLVRDAAGTAASITTVNVNGYGVGSEIGAAGAPLSKLSSLSLSNSASTGTYAFGTTGTVTVNAKGATTLALTVSNVRGAVNLDGFAAGDATLKTLNLAGGASSSLSSALSGTASVNFALTASTVETLNLSGSVTVDLTNSTLSALKTATVTGAASTRLTNQAATLEAVNTTGTTGSMTAIIDGGKATYAGGAGVDTVALVTTAALTKAIDLGAGNDTLQFGTTTTANAVTGSTAAVNGGDGTDTLAMSVVNAQSLSGTRQTFYTNFERLSLYAGADDATLNLVNLLFTDYVTVTGTAAGKTLTINGFNSGATLVSNAANSGTVVASITGAADSTTDVLNLTMNLTTADRSHGTFSVANVETINLTSTDTSPTASGLSSIQTNSITLTAPAATAINLGTSNAHTNLTLTGSTKVASIDGSSMTGNLYVTSLNTTTATTIRGGSGRDILQMASGTTADVLSGGAGSDVLVANQGLGSMTGGTGNDLFVIGVASANVNSYSTISDFSADDLIKMTGINAFKSARVTLGDTAVFQDFANAAILALGVGEAGWFQFGGNTYIVADMGANGSSFTNGEDFIVKLNGLVDLANATFNNDFDTIGLAG